METIYRCKRCTEVMFEGAVRGMMDIKCPVCKAPQTVGILEASSDFDVVAGIKNNMIES